MREREAHATTTATTHHGDELVGEPLHAVHGAVLELGWANVLFNHASNPGDSSVGEAAANGAGVEEGKMIFKLVGAGHPQRCRECLLLRLRHLHQVPKALGL